MNSAQSIHRIGVFTSGGDAPGMNAAIRAVVRTALAHNKDVIGIQQGYIGLLEKHFKPMEQGSVANIIQRGGTMLKTGRCLEFHKPEVRKIAAQNIINEKIDGLICIGGDGSFQGAHLLGREHNLPIVGVPATIDNDIYGSDNTIGFDTAVNTALEAIDRIRDTAASHDRLFIVEVMGRNSGFIATQVGLAGGAEDIFIPEKHLDLDETIQSIRHGMARGKKSSILIAAEGQKPGRAYDLAEAIRKKAGFEAKVCILGHVQRGGSPTANDRILASRMGSAAVQMLIQNKYDIFVGIQNGTLMQVPFKEGIEKKRQVSKEWIELVKTLSQ